MKAFTALLFILATTVWGQVNAGPQKPEASLPFKMTTTATFGLPWRIAFLPDGRMLVTEKIGPVWLVSAAGEKIAMLSGTPPVYWQGQNGMLGVFVSPKFATDQSIYLTYIEPGDYGGAQVLARGRLNTGRVPRLEDLTVLWRQMPKGKGGQAGGQIAFSPDGQYIFMTVGDRQRMTPAQDPNQPVGKILRLTLDGKPAPGNPNFGKTGAPTIDLIDPPRDTEVAKTAKVVSTYTFPEGNQTPSETWAMGFRAPYGLAFAPNGELWEVEHGPRGGDELNLIEKGKNYGWPVVSFGKNYNEVPIPSHDSRPEFAKPVIYWVPVIAPGNLMFYRGGKMFPQWEGSGFISGLATQSLNRIVFDGKGGAKTAERWEVGKRIRDVEQGPDGSLWMLEDANPGALIRVTPNGDSPYPARLLARMLIFVLYAVLFAVSVSCGYGLTRRIFRHVALPDFAWICAPVLWPILLLLTWSVLAYVRPCGVPAIPLLLMHLGGLAVTVITIRKEGFDGKASLPWLGLAFAGGLICLAPSLANGSLTWLDLANHENLNYTSNAQWFMGRVVDRAYEPFFEATTSERYGAEALLAMVATLLNKPPVWVLPLFEGLIRANSIAAFVFFLFALNGRKTVSLDWRLGFFTLVYALLPLEILNQFMAFLGHHLSAPAVILLFATFVIPATYGSIGLQALCYLFLSITYPEMLPLLGLLHVISAVAVRDRMVGIPLLSIASLAVVALVNLPLALHNLSFAIRFSGSNAGFNMLGSPPLQPGFYLSGLFSHRVHFVQVQATGNETMEWFLICVSAIVFGGAYLWAAIREKKYWLLAIPLLIALLHLDPPNAVAGVLKFYSPAYRGPKAMIYFSFVHIAVLSLLSNYVLRWIPVALGALYLFTGAQTVVALAKRPADLTEAALAPSLEQLPKDGPVGIGIGDYVRSRLWHQLAEFAALDVRLNGAEQATALYVIPRSQTVYPNGCMRDRNLPSPYRIAAPGTVTTFVAEKTGCGTGATAGSGSAAFPLCRGTIPAPANELSSVVHVDAKLNELDKPVPLISWGTNGWGKGLIVYAIPRPERKYKVAVDVWGIGHAESADLPMGSTGADVEVAIDYPAHRITMSTNGAKVTEYNGNLVPALTTQTVAAKNLVEHPWANLRCEICAVKSFTLK